MVGEWGMPIFRSNATNKVDNAGRVTIPAAIRDALPKDQNSSVTIVPSLKHPCIQGGDSSMLARLSDRIEAQFGPYSDEYDYMVNEIYGQSEDVEFDSKHRIKIPQFMLDEAGITKEAIIVGLRDKFEIWNPDRYAEYRSGMKEKALQSAMKLGPLTTRRGEGD